MAGERHHTWIPALTALCREASAVILSYYGREDALATQHKRNNTPLTAADIAAHRVLADGLPRIADVPVVSEESEPSHRAQHSAYWLIDPIDGTREFIRQSGEFCILIALIEQHRPTLAMIYAPTSQEYWYAIHGAGSYKCDHNGKETRLFCRTPPPIPAIITHNFPQSKRLQNFLQQTFGDYQHLSLGSALKFCAIAEGRADIYPKIVPKTSEWDIAAGDLLLHEAGGGIRFADGSLPRYGLSADLINPPFLAFSRLNPDLQTRYLDSLAHLISETPNHA